MKSPIIFLNILFFSLITSLYSYGQNKDTIAPRHVVTLRESHIGDLEIDTKLLDSYGRLPDNIRTFYLDARSVLVESSEVNFTHSEIINTAQKYDLSLMGGPMLGNLKANGVSIWMRPAFKEEIEVSIRKKNGLKKESYYLKPALPGLEQRLIADGLDSGTKYEYAVYSKNKRIAEGKFTTAPDYNQKGVFKLAFGSCFHKIGVHNINLINQILNRKPQAMMLLGDIAVDDRVNKINLHRSDYLLRDVSKAWRQLSANVPLYTSWDDHDYFDNDLGGIPKGFTEEDREAVRAVWDQNWNNPKNENPGIYFNTRIGPVEVIMLDTRSCRENERRGKYGSFLGLEQLKWLKKVLKKSEAPFKVISSGTMWSDYVSNGKDSWGTWDTEAREELFNFIETENISGVLLVSGDRHGARGFTIPRPSGFSFYEFQVASLGGVPGPDAMAEDKTNQLFGYHGTDVTGFGEFIFNTKGNDPHVVFRLIDEFGNVLEEHSLPYKNLKPREK